MPVSVCHRISSQVLLKSLPPEDRLISKLFVLEHLFKAYPGEWISHERMYRALYGEPTSGGPLHFQRIISLLVMELRRRGSNIKVWHKHGYALDPIEWR